MCFLKHHSDIEWKFARSKLYLEYIREGFTLPVPLNLIPAPHAIYRSNLIKKCWQRIKENQSKLKQLNSISHMDEPPSFEMKSQLPSPKTPNQTNSVKVRILDFFTIFIKLKRNVRKFIFLI